MDQPVDVCAATNPIDQRRKRRPIRVEPKDGAISAADPNEGTGDRVGAAPHRHTVKAAVSSRNNCLRTLRWLDRRVGAEIVEDGHPGAVGVDLEHDSGAQVVGGVIWTKGGATKDRRAIEHSIGALLQRGQGHDAGIVQDRITAAIRIDFVNAALPPSAHPQT